MNIHKIAAPTVT